MPKGLSEYFLCLICKIKTTGMSQKAIVSSKQIISGEQIRWQEPNLINKINVKLAIYDEYNNNPELQGIAL